MQIHYRITKEVGRGQTVRLRVALKYEDADDILNPAIIKVSMPQGQADITTARGSALQIRHFMDTPDIVPQLKEAMRELKDAYQSAIKKAAAIPGIDVEETIETLDEDTRKAIAPAIVWSRLHSEATQ